MGDELLVGCGSGLTFAVVAVAVAGFVGRDEDDEIDSTRLDPFLTMTGGS